MNNFRLEIIASFMAILAFVSCQSKKEPVGSTPLGETLITVVWDTVSATIQHCTARLEGGNLKFTIEESGNSPLDFAIQGSQHENYITLSVTQGQTILDSSFMPSRFQILNHDITLNKDSYRRGDNLEGRLAMLLLGHRSYFRNEGEMEHREDWDTLRISGNFQAIVQ